jgi:hypothetical protein
MPGKRKNGTLENESDYFKSPVYDTISSSAEFACGCANFAAGSLSLILYLTAILARLIMNNL